MSANQKNVGAHLPFARKWRVKTFLDDSKNDIYCKRTTHLQQNILTNVRKSDNVDTDKKKTLICDRISLRKSDRNLPPENQKLIVFVTF